MQDDEIIALYWRRDENAIREMEQKHSRYLSKIAYNILSDIEDSKECVNDTVSEDGTTVHLRLCEDSYGFLSGTIVCACRDSGGKL